MRNRMYGGVGGRRGDPPPTRFALQQSRKHMVVSALDRIFYPNHADHWDDALLRRSILRRLAPDFVLLDLGAGSGRVQEMQFRRLCK